MKTTFRQGLISYQQAGPLPIFLLPSGTPGYVALNIAPTAFIATIAHGSSDYLLKFDTSVPTAWGPMISGLTNYLYLELNVITGAISFGVTTLEPISSIPEPALPVPNQMWFDLTHTVMKVRNGDNTKWIDSPRVVVGHVLNGNTNQIVHSPSGSSVGLNGVPGNPGSILNDSQLRPLRTSTGELLTTDSPVRVRTTVGTSGVLTNPANNFIPVRANEPIPAMSLVYLSGVDSVSLASSNPALVILKTPIGVVETPLAANEVGVITQIGEITYDQWDWSASIGRPLYCGWSGEITTVRPQGLQVFRVGYVKSPKTILFYIDSETQPQVYSSAGAIISGTPPIDVITNVNGSGEIVSTISMLEATPLVDGFMSAAYATDVESYGVRIDAAELDIVDLQTNKSNVGHVHTIANVTGLQTKLDALDAVDASKAGLVVGAVLDRFASLTALGDLADSGFSASSFSLVGHTHTIVDVAGLQTALNGKANVVHSHIIADTTGLQTALDNKADFNHTHVISNVSGLQTALDGKAPVVHNHVISNVTGLQTELDGKVAKAGDTMTGLLILSGAPSVNLGAATKQYVDAADALKVSKTGDTMTGQLQVTSITLVSNPGPIPGWITSNNSSELLTGNAGIRMAFQNVESASSTFLADYKIFTTRGGANHPDLLFRADSYLHWREDELNPLNARWMFNNGDGGSSHLMAYQLDDLEDVDLSTLVFPGSIGYTLKWNGTQWVPAADSTFTPGSINAFTDVDTATVPPAVDEVLKWNGTNWIPGVSGGGGGGFVFQVGVPPPGADHYHYALLSMADVQYLIQNTFPANPVADPLQPSVVITSLVNNSGYGPHSHDITVFFDYVNHTFIGTNVTSNHPVPHVAYLVGDGVGSGSLTPSSNFSG